MISNSSSSDIIICLPSVCPLKCDAEDDYKFLQELTICKWEVKVLEVKVDVFSLPSGSIWVTVFPFPLLQFALVCMFSSCPSLTISDYTWWGNTLVWLAYLAQEKKRTGKKRKDCTHNFRWGIGAFGGLKKKKKLMQFPVMYCHTCHFLSCIQSEFRHIPHNAVNQ